MSFTPLFTYKVLKLQFIFLKVEECFTPLFTYKVLKPQHRHYKYDVCFTPLFTYKVLKLLCFPFVFSLSFTPLFTYKVLKPIFYQTKVRLCFTPLFTYKVLKPQIQFQGYHRTYTYWHMCKHLIVLYITQSRCKIAILLSLICYNATVFIKNIHFLALELLIKHIKFYQH